MYAFVDGLDVGAAFDLGMKRRFVGIADAGEMGYVAGARFAVKTLHVAVLAHGERRVNVNLDEVGDARAHLVTGCAKRRYRGHDNIDAVAREQLRDEADTPDIFVTVGAAESQVPAEHSPDVVAVEHFDFPAGGEQAFEQCTADAGFTRGTQAG